MTAVCPTTGHAGACPWLALETSRHARVRGWVCAGTVVASLLAGLALLAAPAPPTETFAVALTAAPLPAAPPLTAFAEAAPDAMPDPVPDRMQPNATDAPPKLTQADQPPTLPPQTSLPEATPDTAPLLDTAPPLPEPAKPPAKPKPKKAKTQAQPAPKPDVAAPATTAKVSGSVSPKAWANAVVKQIRKTPKHGATGRGTVQIGFTVGANGALTAIKVLKSSGDPQVDAMGLDHIRRAAPFPAPPADANRNLAFAFELR